MRYLRLVLLSCLLRCLRQLLLCCLPHSLVLLSLAPLPLRFLSCLRLLRLLLLSWLPRCLRLLRFWRLSLLRFLQCYSDFLPGSSSWSSVLLPSALPATSLLSCRLAAPPELPDALPAPAPPELPGCSS
jgi:hypothetical protein